LLLTDKTRARYETSMNEFFASERMARRAIIAALVACLFALQGLALGATQCHLASSRGAGSMISSVMLAEHCEGRAGKEAPAHDRHDHSQCCIFCADGGREAAFVVIASFFSIVSYSASETSVSAAHLIRGDDGEHSSGLTVTWSSRGPPFVA